jgi:DNA-binding transcriptional MerR regulator
MQENLQGRKYYKADELASILGVKKFVIRTWESQFDLNRSTTQYCDEDLVLFETIKDLLYEKKLSPVVARQQLPAILSQKIKQAQLVVDVVEEKVVENVQEFSSIEAAVEPQVLMSEVTARVIAEPESEIVAATRTAEASENQVQPAFKQNQEFWNNLKTLKEQLLTIQEQLK